MQLTNSLFNGNKAIVWAVCLLLLVSLLNISACGWRLRGSYEFPASMARVYVKGAARYSELGNMIHSTFQGTNSTLVNSADDATAILHILADKSDKRILATDSSGRASEYEISYVLSFKLTDAKGAVMVGEQQVSAKREYRFDPANVLASGGEVEALQQDMLRNSVQQMMRRINANLASQP